MLLASPTSWVVLSDMARNGLGAWPSIAFQRPDRGVARAGKQYRGVGPILGSVRERGVPQLVERPPVGSLAEQLRGAPIGQSGPTGVRAQIYARYGARRLAIGEEHWAKRASSQQSREQECGAGLPEHPLDGSTFASDTGAFVGKIKLLDVE